MSFYSKFAAFYEAIFPFSQNVADFLNKHCSTPQSCLDVGCGTGHYAGYLAGRGLQAIGIDLDASMIAYAKQHYPDATFHCMDMRAITELGTTFDFIFCVGNSGAHLPRQDFNRFIANVRTVLVPGGTWIIQLMNWDYVLSQEFVQFPQVKTENNLKFNRVYTHISSECVQFETSLLRGNNHIFEETVPLHPIVTEDLIDLHTKLGFTLEGHFGNYNQDPFNPDIFSASIYVFSAPTN